MKISVDNQILEYNVIGKPYKIPDDRVLLHEDDDLTQNADWSRDGFSVQKLFEPIVYESFYSRCITLLKKLIESTGFSLSPDFDLANYHQLIGDNYKRHLDVIEMTKLVGADDFPIPFEMIEQRISDLCNIELHSLKPLNGERVFHFRIIRPESIDFNPLHKDVWQDENRDAVNIYVPLVGSNKLSSLILAKGSHLISENNFTRSREGAVMNNVQFNVPGLQHCEKELEFIRPNPQENEVLVFSPYLIHGGAMNLNRDSTRISLEIRFWRK